MKTRLFFLVGILIIISSLFIGCAEEHYDCSMDICSPTQGGPYLSMAACQKDCGGASGSGYICTNNSCVQVSTGAKYGTISACQNSCGNTSGAGYNCVSGNCVSVSSGATYVSLSACQSNCSSSGGAGYNCTSGNCVSVSSGAAYSTLSACQSNCSSSTNLTLDDKWINSNGSVITISGSTGIYTVFGPSNQAIANLGLIKLGDLGLKNISKTSTYKWNCLALCSYSENSVVKALFWSTDGVITMSNDGKTISIFSNRTYNGTPSSGTSTYMRQ
ncbi:MAG: hypothetical protein IPK03_10265 [Bacteroidetes bacterium]|nr:hypothetical protein [Bacteroidota bacterium]